MTQKFSIFIGVFFFGLALMCGLEGVADRIRDHQNLAASEWLHMTLSFATLFASAWSFSHLAQSPQDIASD